MANDARSRNAAQRSAATDRTNDRTKLVKHTAHGVASLNPCAPSTTSPIPQRREQRPKPLCRAATARGVAKGDTPKTSKHAKSEQGNHGLSPLPVGLNAARLLPGGTVEIELTLGQFALVDLLDWAVVRCYRWLAWKHPRTGIYYVQTRRKSLGPHPKSLHRLLLQPEAGMVVDHINHNGLDNRKVNIRVATPQQNTANQRPRWGRQFKGTMAQGNKWKAEFMVNGRRWRLGTFDTEEAAARAYDQAAFACHGEFAYLNFPGAIVRDQRAGSTALGGDVHVR